MKNRWMVIAGLALVTTVGANAQSTSAESADRAEGTAPVQNNLQVTGTVLETDANRLVVRLDNGQQMTFIVTGESEGVTSYRVGDRVTANYASLAGTGAVVKRLSAAPMTTTTQTTTTTYVPPAEPVRPTTVEPVRPTPVTAAPTPVADPYPATAAPAPSAMDNDDDSMTTLPATASDLPLLALLGLGAVGGALVARKISLS